MSAMTDRAIASLIDAHSELAPILDEHLHDNGGEMLPHLVKADIVRWLVTHRASNRDVCRSVPSRMERCFVEGPDVVRGMIVISGLEMIPDPGQPGSELRNWLGPSLRDVDP